MKQKKPRDNQPVEIEFEGKKHTGTYYVEGKCVTVTSKFGLKGDVCGRLGAQSMAEHLLRELLMDAKRERRL